MVNPETVDLPTATSPSVLGNFSSELYLYDAEGRLLVTNLSCKNQQLNVACVYVPANSTLWALWLENTTNFLVSLESRIWCDLVAGDWNTVINTMDHTSRCRPNLQERHRLLSFLSFLNDETGLLDGFREHFPDTILYTHKSPNSEARLDQIYVTPALYHRSFDWKTHVLPNSLNLDHDMVAVGFKPIIESKRGPGRFHFKCNLMKSKPVQECLTLFINKIREMPVTPSRWASLKNDLEKSLSVVVRTKTHALSAKHSQIKRKRLRLLLQRRASPNPSLEQKINAIIAREGQLNEFATRAYAYSALAKNRLLGEKPTRWFYSRFSASSLTAITALQSRPGGPIVENPPDLPVVAAAFYEVLFAEQPTNARKGREFIDLMPKIPRALGESISAPITSTEVRAAIKGAPTGKSPGPDGLPIELLKEVLKSSSENAEYLCEGLAHFFNSLLRGEVAAESFSIGVLSILYKNHGSTLDLKNYRPLTVANMDYKLFTSILTCRLCTALDDVIGSHQYAFLPGRLIDDNIRLVQSIIEENKGRENDGIYLLFIDQEKAYDHVDHNFFWHLLKKVGLPRPIRRAIRALYADIKLKVMVNGFTSSAFPVMSGVRQGDPLSCVLYVLFLEPLIRKLNASEIEGIPIPNSELTNPKKIEYTPENPYLHLGIPMGTDTMAQVQTLWEDVRMNFENIANKWSGAHLSLKGRVMVANSLMLSLPRYHLKFIPISTQTLKKLVKIYYDFIWVHKVHQKLHDSHALLPPERGGIGSFDLASVVTALSVEMISKLEYCGDLPWVQIQHCLLKNLHTRTQGEISSVITRPWIQRISSRELQEDVLPSCVRHLWLHWRRALNADSDTILLCSPATKQDVLNTNFWYHKDLKTLPRQGARHFSNNTYRFLADHDVTKIGDIWDADNQEVIFPAMLPNSQRRAMKQAVMTLIHDLPDSWLQLLEGNLSGTTPNNGQLCLTVVQGNLKNALPLEKVGFRLIYRQLVLKKTANVNYDHRVQPILQAYQRHTGRPGSPEMIWRTA
ncbi:related to Retrovirus-related POL polyprotein [Ustilago hordei]|uniref:Related to Retrovirus-related POL polyprotein n=1 Tax=Ustilago hordei TaxID=120017 RepID=I2FM30_USTHO|nr:related to Retrovirus-related POL polyprotein [Ustilago hordei]